MSALASTPRQSPSLVAALGPAVMLSWGWRRCAIALVSGAVGALAMPPFGFVPALAVSMIAAVWLIDGSSQHSERAGAFAASLLSAFGVGWWWGFGYFLAALWWLGAAFLVDAAQFAWALPLGVIALPAALALYPAIGFMLARAVWPHGAARPLALAFGLGLAEWLRAVLFTGFPWDEFGLAFGEHLWLAQGAALFGLHGLTLLVIAILAAPATLWDGRGWRRWAPTGVALVALAGLAAYGQQRLTEPPPAAVAGVKLRVLQTNLSQGADFTPEKGAEILGRYLALSGRPAPGRAGDAGVAGVIGDANVTGDASVTGVTHLIWPESAFPFLLAREPGALARIAEFLQGGAVLATGAARVDMPAAGRPARYYNSILTLNRAGLLPVRYDKRHLVPFGEFLPFRAFWDKLGVTQFVHIPGGFSPGRGSNLLPLPGAPEALAEVCYEAIFPNEEGGARAGAAERAGWILNVTDDAWFGLTPGPYQHFAQARLRAIEWGLPLARAANGGISAIFDAYGRIVASGELGSESIVDGVLPGALPPTPESRWGSLTFALGLALALGVSLSTRVLF